MDKNIDLIDNYLTGNLSQEELVVFESSIAADPSLKTKVDFQDNMIKSIKEHRKNELKTRLNSINVASSPSLLWQKVAIAASAVIISGTLAFYLTQDNSKEEEVIASTPAITEKQVNKEVPENKGVIAPIITEKKQASETFQEKEIIRPIQNESVTTITKEKNQVAITDPFQNAPNPNINDEDVQIDHELDNTNKLNTSAVKLKDNGLKVYPENKKNRFHYKYDGKIILVQIANYSDESPAVLIDYPERKEVFMNYKGIFYQLGENKSWQNLSDQKISNPNLITALKEKIK